MLHSFWLKMRSSSWLWPDPLWELTALPKTSYSWITEKQANTKERVEEDEGERGMHPQFISHTLQISDPG